MGYFAYIPDKDGNKQCGTFDNRIISDLKTLRGALNRLKQYVDYEPHWKNKPFVIQYYTNLYDESTFRTVYTHKPVNNGTQNIISKAQ